jgi:FixJ family two-component response regulator
LVILDIKMPEINGFELYDKFKSKDAKIKTLFLTALSDVEAYSTQSSKAYPIMGERHFAKKPISNDDLLQQVYSIMN